MADRALKQPSRNWKGYYRWIAARPPRELLLRTLDHIDWEGRRRTKRLAIDLGFGSGTDTIELLRRGWRVLAVDQEEAAARFLEKRLPARNRASVTTLVAPLEGLELPSCDLIYASYSLPFCSPAAFPVLWASIRAALVPGGHFAGQLFGDRDEWAGHRVMSFHSSRQIPALTRGFKVELVRETEEDGQAFDGPKHWHVFDLILEKPARS
jgi:SAM-dependent methyltransferase